MKKIQFGGGVSRQIGTLKTPQLRAVKSRNLDSSISPEEVVEIVQITFTVLEAVKIFFAAVGNFFKRK